MLKPPIILPIVPSKYWLLAQCGLLIGLVALSYWVGGKLAAVAMLVLGGGLGWCGYLRQPKGVLSLTLTALQVQGRWLRESQHEVGALTGNEDLSDADQVRCDYLGPWLIGLYVGTQRVWLWPDSVPHKGLREVRQLFHRPGR